MSDWSAGYVADIGYTFGYFSELNPLLVELAFLKAGLVPPESGTACELGFGQGMSANIHAAGSGVQWFGTDFIPSQAAFAKELAVASSNNAQLFDDAFADFCSRPELPDFDYIGLHGIWSWISDENRAVIVDFVRRKLKVGGVLYISYNTLPGWSTFAPMRHLLTQHAGVMGADGAGIVERIEGALGFADQLLATNPLYSKVNTTVPERLEKLKEQNRNYLAHEYFNADWHPMYFADMAKWLSPAKMSFACSTNLLDHVDAINLTPEQQTLLKSIPDTQLRQSVRDYMVNQQFRKDYWVKGGRKLSTLDQSEGLRALRVLLVTQRSHVPLKVTASLGECSLHEAIYSPLLDSMADHKIKTIGQLEQSLRDKNMAFSQLVQALIILSSASHVQLVQDDAVIVKAKKCCDKLNTHLMNLSRSSNDMAYLASPVSGGGVSVSRFQQMFLLARTQGHKQPADWAQFTWHILAAQGQRLIKEGRQLETPEENLAELTEQATAFGSVKLPILKALQVA